MLPERLEAEPDDNQSDHRTRGSRRHRSITRIESGGEEDDKSAHQVKRMREDNTTQRGRVSVASAKSRQVEDRRRLNARTSPSGNLPNLALSDNRKEAAKFSQLLFIVMAPGCGLWARTTHYRTL